MLWTDSDFLEMKKTEQWEDSVCFTQELMTKSPRTFFYLNNEIQMCSECYVISPKEKVVPFFLKCGWLGMLNHVFL